MTMYENPGVNVTWAKTFLLQTTQLLKGTYDIYGRTHRIRYLGIYEASRTIYTG